MKQTKNGKSVLHTLILTLLAAGMVLLGIFAGALATSYLFLSERTDQSLAEQTDWLTEDVNNIPCRWSYMKIDANGWSASYIDNLLKMKELVNTSEKEIVIPIFPTVYEPNPEDELYYNVVLQSDIAPGDKVLVIGAGSGSDAWAAWLKSQSLIYVVEINPMGIANIKTTARIGNFPVKPILGDIREVDLPEDFSDFDWVLWNMPFLGEHLEEHGFHDGDDGDILRKFLALLPSLLKKDGQAIIMNHIEATGYIKFPNLKTFGEGNILVFTFSNYSEQPAAGSKG